MIPTWIIALLASALPSVIFGVYLKKRLPIWIEKMGSEIWKKTQEELPAILEDVGLSVAEKLEEVFASPPVKRAMSVLGKKSGDVRAADALRGKAADKILEQYPSIGLILDQLEITPVEGLQLLRDPLVGPWIQGVLQKGISGVATPNSSKQNNSDVFKVT